MQYTLLAPSESHALYFICGTSVAAKNSSHQNKKEADENTPKYLTTNNAIGKLLFKEFSNYRPAEVLMKKMWQNTRSCVNFVGVLINNASVRGYKSSVVCNSARSSPAEPGYVSEDKILQIKQHRNDFAQQYPAVTLILNKTMSEETRKVLDKWKQDRIAEMGVEEFNKYYEGIYTLFYKVYICTIHVVS